ncbi:MAG: M23 family metallopeptidase, partial [Myxococcales bacterium]|nr:M23 family metallopeptidase [Myxococcales bacterium]
EPATPSNIDAARFTKALNILCGTNTKLRRARHRMTARRAAQYSKLILEWSAHFGVDPYLVSSLIYRRSRCSARLVRENLVGLSLIDIAAHRRHVRSGQYRYYMLDGDNTWRLRELDVSKFRFSRRSLLRPAANIYFTAALLSIYKRQAPFLAKAVRQVSHRHYISHFVWGDRVRSARDEDYVLEARRRMLHAYADEPPAAMTSFKGMALHCPLDGFPRKIMSGYRAWRGRGRRRRRHRAVDFYSTYGEPIRAMADGEIIFAGLQKRGRGGWILPPHKARGIPRRWMGIGGLFVTIKHAKGLRSGYFHMSGYTVRKGQKVKAGQVIGWVGRTGIKHSDPHLHFEIRRYRRRVNPVRFLRKYLLPPQGKYPKKKKGKHVS